MSMVVKKRQVVMATLVVALGAAVFVNWYFTQPEAKDVLANATQVASEVDESTTPHNLGDAQYVSGTLANGEVAVAGETEGAYFVEAKVNRQTAHDEAAEAIQNIIGSDTADASAKEKASNDLSRLADTLKKETDIESLIRAKITGSCVVILDSEQAQVVVETGKLSDNTALQIKEIVMKQTEVSAENITIIEAK